MSAAGLAERLKSLGIIPGKATSDNVPEVKTVVLKDKHSHVYAIVALKSTDFSLKVLSARLGLGKGFLQNVPEAALAAILQSPAHSTFLGLAEAAARQVVSIVDAGIAKQAVLQVPAADGSEPIMMSGADIDTFLRSLGGTVSTVDLSLAPKIDRDNPPDLKQLADSAAIVEEVKSAVTATQAPCTIAVTSKSKAAATGKSKKAATPSAAGQPTMLNVDQMVDTIVTRCLSLGGGGQQYATPDSEAMRTLLADVRMELHSLKNAAYASGFAAARGAMRAHLEPPTFR